MFGINEISKTAKFRYIKYGYNYKIRAIDWDGHFCNVYFELLNNMKKVSDMDEVKGITEEIICDILSLDYFVRMKVKKYNPNANLRKIEDNIYEMKFSTEERKLHPIILLSRYCNGHEVQVLTGNLEGKAGIYRARLNDIDERGFIESVEIDGQAHNLKGCEFQLINSYAQLSWESILKN